MPLAHAADNNVMYGIIVVGVPRSMLGPHADLGGVPACTGPDALVALITAPAGAPAGRVSASAGLTDRILGHALANLSDPALSVESAAARFGISTRYLHKLLKSRDLTFAAWVRRERLRRIRRDLLDPAFEHRTVAAIAARWGILDHTHLARSCKAEFGQTPADLRRSRTLKTGPPKAQSLAG